MSVKKPEPKFGVPEEEPKAKAIFIGERGHTDEITVWHNEDYKPVSKYAIYGDYEGGGRKGSANAAFMKWYLEQKLVPTSEKFEDDADHELIEQARREAFEWAKKNNPNLSYYEWLDKHRHMTIEFRENFRPEEPRGNADHAPEHHFLFATFESDSPDE